MKKMLYVPAILAALVLASACSSMPRTTSSLDQARSDYQQALNSPSVATYASLELKQAGDALEQANSAAAKDESNEAIDKLAYLAKQKIALTQEVAKQKSAEANIASTGKERDQMRLDQRTNEANQAKAGAVQANAAAAEANAAAAQAKLDTQLAQVDAADAQRKMALAQGQAVDAQTRTAQLEAQIAELAAKKTARGLVITLGDVLFGTDLSRLNADGMRTAQKLASVLQQNPQRTVLVEGFTDSTGSNDHNQVLSDRRAGAVQSALVGLGVARGRVSIKGYGEAYPVAANDTATNRQLNRRVEIVLSDDSGKITPR